MFKKRPLLDPNHFDNKNKNRKNYSSSKKDKIWQHQDDLNGHNDDKRKKRQEKLLEDEKLLEEIVFNTNASLLSQIDKDVTLVSIDLNKNLSNNDQDDLPNDIFVVDRSGDERNIDLNDVVEDSEDNHQQSNQDDQNDDEHSHRYTTELFNSSINKSNQESKPLWHDDDDDIDAAIGFQGVSKLPKLVKSDDKYKQYLERKFNSIYEPPSWAKKALETSTVTEKNKKLKKASVDSSESDDDDDQEEIPIEQTAFDQIKSKDKFKLDKDFIHLKKCSHLNVSSKIKTSLNCVNFHPNSTVALVGSQIGLIRLFQVDGKLNSMIQSIYFRGYRLSDAKFISNNGREEIIVGSDGSNPKSIGYCYYYDMVAGKIVRISLSKGGKVKYSLRGFKISPDGSYLAACDDNGNINLLTANSKELIQEFKVNGEVNCLSFSSDSNYLLAHGQQNGGQAFIFDVRNARRSINCVNRFNDQDTIVATSLDVSLNNNNSLVAIGSNMGVVNLYRFDDVLKQTNPEPLKSVMNLTTAISALKFNHDGQLLMMASNQKNDSIRFLNCNSKTVYKNFPSGVGNNQRTYGRINDLDFSPNSGFASFVTGYGTAHLFRINEYSSY